VKRVIGLVFMCGAASCVAATASPSTAPHETRAAVLGKKTATPKASVSGLAKRAADRETARHSALLLLAPADEYFGPLKLSLIGMRNTIRDLGLRYDVNHDISRQTFASTQLVERSVRDWGKKYAKDDQLPRVIFLLQRLYTKVLSQESRDRAHVVAQWLQSDFARSPQARELTKTLASEHLAPVLPPVADVTPQPASASEPTYRSVFGRGYPSEFAPLATATAEPPATARPTPNASPTPTASASASTPQPSTAVRRTARPVFPVATPFPPAPSPVPSATTGTGEPPAASTPLPGATPSAPSSAVPVPETSASAAAPPGSPLPESPHPSPTPAAATPLPTPTSHP